MWFRQQTATWQSWQQSLWDSLRETLQESLQISWRDFVALSRRLAADEDGFRKQLSRKLLREASAIPFLEDALTAHYCAFDRQTPFHVKAALVGAVVYFIVPDDLIPDSIPVLGLADDAAVLAGAMKLFSNHIKAEHREGARRTLARMRA